MSEADLDFLQRLLDAVRETSGPATADRIRTIQHDLTVYVEVR